MTDPALTAESVRRAERAVGTGLLTISGFVGWSLFGWKGVVLAFAAGVGGMLKEGAV